MEGALLLLHLILLKWFSIIINAEETDNFNKTSYLRYGHHRTHKCFDFEKTYVCINTCLERGYDIAFSNEKCECTCFKDKVKSKYYVHNKNTWKMPTTFRPAWAGSKPSKKQKGLFVLVTPAPTYKIPQFLKYPVNDSELVENGTTYDFSNSSKEYDNETHYGNEEGDAGVEESGEENYDAGDTNTVEHGTGGNDTENGKETEAPDSENVERTGKELSGEQGLETGDSKPASNEE